MRELDPRIHLMDCRVKPGNDEGGSKIKGRPARNQQKWVPVLRSIAR
jgi:hypothetical protein